MKYNEYFQEKTRPCGHSFTCLKDDAPEDLQDLIRSIHFGHFYEALPNDWIYENILAAFIDMEENYDFDSILQCLEADIYHNDLVIWLSNSFAAEYCNEYLEESSPKNIWDILQSGNYRAKQAIYFAVNDFLVSKKEAE